MPVSYTHLDVYKRQIINSTDLLIIPLNKNNIEGIIESANAVSYTHLKEMAENKYAGTQTEKNLQEAFAGESQARNKYTYFASVAKKEGYEQRCV